LYRPGDFLHARIARVSGEQLTDGQPAIYERKQTGGDDKPDYVIHWNRPRCDY
jgi:hypothetical protein